MRHRILSTTILTALLIFFAGCKEETTSEHRESTWWKGNLHTHSLWSDGDDYPEMIVQWYKEQGYHFLSLSDHNVLSEGEQWIDTTRNNSGSAAFDAYIQAFGREWVETREQESFQVRLKPLEEFRAIFEKKGSFLLIQSEEISDGFNRKPVHVNATNIVEVIEPQKGSSIREVMQNNVDAVLEQRKRLNTPMFPHINHPNFGWAMTAEDLITLMGEQFFEVYNGHPAVNNYGDEARPGMEKMWDIITTRRILNGVPIMYGIAVDDSHNYHEIAVNRSNSGRAWVMVRSDELNAVSLINAMERGDFYGTTGVEIIDIQVNDANIQIDIKAEEGVTYETQFIGTRVQHDTTSTPVQFLNAYVTRSYSDEIGEVLEVAAGPRASYSFTGEELYVRARVISSKSKHNPYREGETEMAWTQPVLVADL